MQARQCVEQRLHIGLINLAASFEPVPSILLIALQRQILLSREAYAMDLFGFKLKDRQLLPLQGIE